ncbi:uncharacterized protein FFC1_06521 [Fusarium fujikuroi]|nr:uncharacterized protein FFC1_06521 [Fusarium fujikuroi]
MPLTKKGYFNKLAKA